MIWLVAINGFPRDLPGEVTDSMDGAGRGGGVVFIVEDLRSGLESLDFLNWLKYKWIM